MKSKRHPTAPTIPGLRPEHGLPGGRHMNGESFCRQGDLAHGETTKERLLDAAFRAFAEQGLDGVSVREICERAEANVAAAHYHFHGKDKLYAAVVERAVEQLRAKAADKARHSDRRTPRQKLRAAIESLFECLTRVPDSAWLVRLVARELAEQGPGFDRIAAALRTHAARLEEPLRQLLGPRTSRDRVHLCALSVTSECVFFCATQSSLRRLCPQLGSRLADTEQLIAHVVRFTTAAVEGMAGKAKAAF